MPAVSFSKFYNTLATCNVLLPKRKTYTHDRQCRRKPKWCPPNCNNWPSIFWRPLFSRHLTVQQPSYICTRPEIFFPYVTWGPWAYVSLPPGTGGLSTGSDDRPVPSTSAPMII